MPVLSTSLGTAANSDGMGPLVDQVINLGQKATTCDKKPSIPRNRLTGIVGHLHYEPDHRLGDGPARSCCAAEYGSSVGWCICLPTCFNASRYISTSRSST
jgi:hypothetical protein